MSGTPRRTDLGSRIDRLEKEMAAMQRTSTLTSASISEGGLTIRRGGNLTVRDGGNVELVDDGTFRIGKDASITVEGNDGSIDAPVLSLGSIYFQGEEVARGLFIYQQDGTQVAILADDGASIMDAEGRDVLATHRNGYGITSPWLTWGWVRSDLSGWATTDSSSWTTLYESRPITLHPRLRLEAGFITGGTSGQVRFLLDGSVVGTSPVYSSSSNYGVTVNIEERSGMALKHSAVVELQARRTSGDSTVAVRPYQALGRDPE